MQKHLTVVHFSPTGGTRRAALLLAEGLAKIGYPRLVSLFGGLQDNAIPNAAKAEFVIPADQVAAVKAAAEAWAAEAKAACPNDPDFTFTWSDKAGAAAALSAEDSRKAVDLILAVPNGIQAMNPDLPGQVQTSLNLGILTTGDDAVHASFSVRSSVATQKQMLIDRLRCLTESLGGSVSTHGEYPGWEFMPQSPLRDLMVQVFTDQYGYAPKVEAIHAGLECGLFSAKLPGLDCVSFGPDLKEIHTFRESLSVSSVQRVYAMVVETLKRMH